METNLCECHCDFRRPRSCPRLFAENWNEAIEEIKKVQAEARKGSAEEATQPVYPVLIARIPKGWTGPKAWEGTPIEGGFRAHQVPIPVDAHHMEHVDALLSWLESYRPADCSTKLEN